jgi:formamidopyrimidine-DNA glycosylase
MPELPEVETVVRDLNSHGICGCSITSVHVNWPRSISGRTPASLCKALKGQKISAVSRRGKYIVIHIADSRRLLVHLRMTGKLLFQPESFKPGKHDHVIFALSNKSKIVFNDTRKFGKITLVSDRDDPTAKLGPEPLTKEFSRAWFHRTLAAKSRQLKPLLLDQSFLAGLGNIYVDEALWDARIHPQRISSSITEDEAAALHKAIRTVLKRGIKNCGTTLGDSDTNFYSVAGRRGRNADQLKVFRRTGEPCPACGTPIERFVVGQRSTHICPWCQRVVC